MSGNIGPRRAATLRRVIATFAPSDARLDIVAQLATTAIEELSIGRRAELVRLLDLLMVPMLGNERARTAVLRFLAESPIEALRSGYAALKRLALFFAYAESAPGSPNPTWARTSYPGPRGDRASAAEPALPFAVARDGERVSADVVVIGSGAGGGVAASAFARAGKRVIVLEAGDAFAASEVTQRELSASTTYLDGGFTATSDLAIAILAGATLGGGTAINWCTSLRLPERIAAEWESESGVTGLAAELGTQYGVVESVLETQPTGDHNVQNRALLEGCRALGYGAEAMPRNAPSDCGDGCGYCGYGCAYGKKRSTTRAFLPALAAADGALYVRARAERITMRGARAQSVRVVQTTADGETRHFDVVADTFVVAGGALRTPGILARSGVAHPLLGKRLFLHPVSILSAIFEQPVETWRGPMQSVYSDAYNFRSGNYGPKIETAPAHGGIVALSAPWVNRAAHAAYMDLLPHAAAFIAVIRDRDPGAIDLDDEAQIRYRVSPHDGENMLAGIQAMAEIAFAAGARSIRTLHERPLEIAREAWTTRRKAEFESELRSRGYAPNRQIFFSAHQMGTASLGADPATSVVDPTGAVWGYENLLVVDASLFPQSSGVNPMLTVMAMAARVASQHGGNVEAESRAYAG